MPPTCAPPTCGTSEADLDHIAHAVFDWRDIWDRYAVDLGARWVSGGWSRGFAPGQVRFGNGARLEMLMPWEVEHDDFLARFLARHGPGAHQLTFKVRDVRAKLRDAVRAGFDPLGVDLSDPGWMEAFLHPKQACGVVVQLAESSIEGGGSGEWSTPPPEGFPTGRRRVDPSDRPAEPGALAWVVHAVADADAARSLFVDLLAGTLLGEGGRRGRMGRRLVGRPVGGEAALARQPTIGVRRRTTGLRDRADPGSPPRGLDGRPPRARPSPGARRGRPCRRHRLLPYRGPARGRRKDR